MLQNEELKLGQTTIEHIHIFTSEIRQNDRNKIASEINVWGKYKYKS